MHFTLKTKLISGFLSVAATGLVIGLFGLSGIRQSRTALTDVRKEVYERGQFLLESTDLARSAQVNFKIQVQEWKNTLLRGNDAEQFEKYWTRFQEREVQVTGNLLQLKELLDEHEVPSELVSSAMEALSALGVSYREAIESYDPENPLAHRIVDKMVKGIDRAPTKQIDEIVDMVHAYEADAAKGRTVAFEASADRLAMVTTGVMFLGVTLAIVAGIWLGGSICKQLRQIASSLREGSEVVDAASREVSSYGQSLADSTNREAASIQQASASLEVLADNTRKNAESAQSATEIANKTRQAVGAGKAQMDEMEKAMMEIRDSSDGISQILKSIDEIAFQTNILALNAAVEAARAGDAGSGFAVVADEVRNLAQRSAKAARETSERIEDSIAKSRHGVDLSARVSLSLDDILGKAAELDLLVANIASSVSQNRDGVGQVNAAIRDIENSYQANAAITEESAAAAQELSEQALSLNQSIGELSLLCGDLKRSESEPKRVSAAKQKPVNSSDELDWPARERSQTHDASLWN